MPGSLTDIFQNKFQPVYTHKAKLFLWKEDYNVIEIRQDIYCSGNLSWETQSQGKGSTSSWRQFPTTSYYHLVWNWRRKGKWTFNNSPDLKSISVLKRACKHTICFKRIDAEQSKVHIFLLLKSNKALKHLPFSRVCKWLHYWEPSSVWRWEICFSALLHTFKSGITHWELTWCTFVMRKE